MSEPTIVCPQCKIEFKLTESLAAPLINSMREEYERQLEKNGELLKLRQDELEEQRTKLETEKQSLESQLATRVEEATAKIVAIERSKARLELESDLKQKGTQLAELQDLLKTRESKLAEAQEAQAAVLKKERQLSDDRRELNLTIETRVKEELGAVAEKTNREVEERYKLKVLEGEQKMQSMKQKIEELQQKAEQGSQQLQGEVQELHLETLLSERFPGDSIEPVPKGEFGGDALHRVLTQGGQQSGLILWESKRTKNWSDGWLAKLRSDQRAAGADVAILVSQSLPKAVEYFDQVDGIWVVSTRCIIPVAIAIRQALLQIAGVRQANEGKLTKMDMVYRYLTGQQFTHRMQAIVEAFSTMQEDLDKERRVIGKQWAKREMQINHVMEATAGMYGDLQGIAGKSLQEIEGLEIAMLQPAEPVDDFK